MNAVWANFTTKVVNNRGDVSLALLVIKRRFVDTLQFLFTQSGVLECSFCRFGF